MWYHGHACNLLKHGCRHAFNINKHAVTLWPPLAIYQVPSQYYTTSYPPSREAAATLFLSKLLMHFSCTWPFSKGMHVLFQEQGCPFPRTCAKAYGLYFSKRSFLMAKASAFARLSFSKAHLILPIMAR